jgi:glycosyltransferase involved in cell wall biosynthesis
VLLFHFGSNHLGKNFEVIFQAAKGLSRPYKLLFAGKVKSASQENNPLRLTKKYGLQQNTIIVDRYLTDEEAKYYFYAVDAVILSHRKDFKGASGVLSNATQYSLPVIAADVGDTGEVVKRYKLGLTFEPENPKSLQEAILSFLNLNEEEKREIKRNLSYFAQTRSWQEVAQRHIEVYQGLIKANSAIK